MVAPLGTGEIDIAAAATSAGLFNAEARGIGLKIVADKGSNLPGYAYVSLLVRKELVDSGKFKSLKDLKGLRVAEPGKGGSTGSTINQALKKGRLALRRRDPCLQHGLSRDDHGDEERRDRCRAGAGTVQHVRARAGRRGALFGR